MTSQMLLKIHPNILVSTKPACSIEKHYVPRDFKESLDFARIDKDGPVRCASNLVILGGGLGLH